MGLNKEAREIRSKVTFRYFTCFYTYLKQFTVLVPILKHRKDAPSHFPPDVTPPGRVIAQAVSRWLPNAVARVRARVRSCGICVGQSDAGAGFLRVLRFPLSIFIPIAPQSPWSVIWGWYNRPVVTAVPSGLSLTPLRIIILIINNVTPSPPAYFLLSFPLLYNRGHLFWPVKAIIHFSSPPWDSAWSKVARGRAVGQ
jgi:hypothetical protein